MMTKVVTVKRRALAANEERADALRSRFAASGTLVANLISSPGSGKTTLLRHLLDDAELAPNRYLYVPQEIPAAYARQRLAALKKMPPAERGQLYQLVAALGLDPRRLEQTDTPSPGEARKLELAHGLAQSIWLLVLDEPTNHLDIPAAMRLHDALASSAAALVLVSHDDAFAADLCDTTWQVDGGRVIVRASETELLRSP